MLAAPTSRQAFVITREIDAPASRVFETLISEAGMKAWAPLCRSARWRNPADARGPGVGSVRELRMHGGVHAQERIVAWEPGRELHYVFDATTLPIAALTRGYVGVTRVEALGAARSRLTWAVHFDAPGPLALLRPAVIASLYPLIAMMADALRKRAENG